MEAHVFACLRADRGTRGSSRSSTDCLAAGADVNHSRVHSYKQSPCEGDTDVARRLLRHGATMHKTDADGRSSLSWATACGHEVVP